MPEERWATGVWEIPLIRVDAEREIVSACLIPNNAIFPAGGKTRLTLFVNNYKEIMGELMLESNVNAFQVLPFHLDKTIIPLWGVVTLRKEPQTERPLALPLSLVQLEIA